MKHISSTIFVTALFLLCAAGALAQSETPKIIRGGILNGKAVSLPKPEYPAEAKSAGVQGLVQVAIVVDENGFIESAKAVKNDKEDSDVSPQVSEARAALRAAAEEAALKAKFSPTLLSGNPVKVSGVITYNFRLADDSTENRKSINGGTLNGKAIELPNPVYPDDARAAKVSGTVSVKVTVDEGGNVISAEAISGDQMLRWAAVDAARKARFSQTLLNGEPVKIVGIITYNFVLDGKPQ
ncbi:MAG TPA: energy transducer TonB [Pyrinomonadaceae bacterium]|nr:energy transducer TonB [Pyrinomonadaceae bacterium]